MGIAGPDGESGALARDGTSSPALVRGSRARVLLYVVLLIAVACGVSFYRLSEGTLYGDEAAFACTTEHMRDTGDLVVPHFGGQPHLNATPLYNWLTLATFSLFDDTPFRHRLWSAVFGVGCILLTFVLGTRLFGSEVGLLAGLLLAFNRDFLFCHGVRFCGMDAMLAFFITGAVLCHVRLRERPAREWPVWAALGLCIGLAWMSKPPVFGVVFLAMITVQHVWSRWGEGLRTSCAGPLLALAVGVVIAAPWYLMMFDRMGPLALRALFVFNSVERAIDPVNRDFFCCIDSTWRSSSGFKLVIPALVGAVVSWWIGSRRAQWSVLLALAGGFLLALTAAGRSGNYIFYTYPLLAVLVAGLLLESGPRLFALLGWSGLRRMAVGGAAALAAVAVDGTKVVRTLNFPVWEHPPVALYARLAPELERQKCYYVLVDYATPDGPRPSGGASNFEDLYYSKSVPLASRVREPAELRPFIATGKPVVVLLPARIYPQPAFPADLVPELRIEQNYWPMHTYPILCFNGLPDGVTADELARIARAGQ